MGCAEPPGLFKIYPAVKQQPALSPASKSQEDIAQICKIVWEPTSRAVDAEGRKRNPWPYQSNTSCRVVVS
jgi:hypothetical protein